VPGHLQNELAVTPLVKERASWWLSEREPAKDKRSRGEPEVLVNALALQPNAFDGLYLSLQAFRSDKVGMNLLKERSDSLEAKGLSVGHECLQPPFENSGFWRFRGEP
jgi:hypothetical protein